MNEIKYPNIEIENLIQNALKEANELGHSWIGSEHVLLAFYKNTMPYVQLRAKIMHLYGNGTPILDKEKVFDVFRNRYLTFEERLTLNLEVAIKYSRADITTKEFVHNFLKDINFTAYEVVTSIEKPIVNYFEEGEVGYETN